MITSSALLYGLSAILVAIWWYIRRIYSYWKRRNVPYVEPTIPYGNLRGVGRRIHTTEFLTDIYTKHKSRTPFVGVYYFADPVAMILDLDLAQNILVRDFSYFQHRKEYYNPEGEPLTAHMAYVEGDKWRAIRKKLSPTFTAGRIKQIMPLVTDLSGRLCEILDTFAVSGEPIEILPLLDRYVTDIAANVIYGIECNSLSNPNTAFRINQEKLFLRQGEFYRIFMQSFPKVARFLNMKLNYDDVNEFFLNLIFDSIKMRESSQLKRNDFLDLLIQLKNTGTLEGHDGPIGKLTATEIAAQAFLFFIASSESTSTTLGNAIYLFSMNEDVQIKTRQEIHDCIAKHGGNMSYEAIMDMKYLHQVVDEVLRLAAPANHLIRKTSRDYKVPGTSHVLEKGTKVVIPIWAYLHDPAIFPDPKTFNPDRFSPELVSKRHPCAFMPFGDGPRACIGVRMGKMIIYTSLANILLRYRVKTSEQTPLTLDYVNNNHALRTVSDFYPELERL